MADRERPDLEERVARLEAAVERLLGQQPGSSTAAPTTPAREVAGPSAPHARTVGASPALESPGTGAAREPRAVDSVRDTAAGAPGAVGSVPRPAAGGGSSAPHTAATTAARSRPPEPAFGADGERWLSRVGIGFVVLAVAFLLKLSFDRGWVTPAVRLVAGFGLAVGLLAVGLRLEPTRRRLAQALLGGSIALSYLVGFAGFQLYGLLPFWIALSLMSTTTVVAFVLAERQDSPPLAVIGVLGGLATPFLLSTGSRNLTGLAIYASLVLLGGGGVQFHRGWTALTPLLLLGGAAALAPVALLDGGPGVLVACLAVGTYWTASAGSWILRPVLMPERYEGVHAAADLLIARVATVAATAVAVPMWSLLLDLERTGTGALLLAFGVAAAATAYRTRGNPLAQWPSAELSALCVAFGVWLIAWGPTAMFLLLAETAVLFVLVSRGAPGSLRPLGHVLAMAAASAFLFYVYDAWTGPLQEGVMTEGALLRLTVLAMLVVCALLVEDDSAAYYKGAAYVGLLLWFLPELAPRPRGAAPVSIAWAVQGGSAMLSSVRTRSQPAQTAGLATLGLVAVKLLLVDLARLDALWRILLFLGFGAGLLGLAYLVNRPGAHDREWSGRESAAS